MNKNKTLFLIKNIFCLFLLFFIFGKQSYAISLGFEILPDGLSVQLDANKLLDRDWSSIVSFNKERTRYKNKELQKYINKIGDSSGETREFFQNIKIDNKERYTLARMMYEGAGLNNTLRKTSEQLGITPYCVQIFGNNSKSKDLIPFLDKLDNMNDKTYESEVNKCMKEFVNSKKVNKKCIEEGTNMKNISTFAWDCLNETVGEQIKKVYDTNKENKIATLKSAIKFIFYNGRIDDGSYVDYALELKKLAIILFGFDQAVQAYDISMNRMDVNMPNPFADTFVKCKNQVEQVQGGSATERLKKANGNTNPNDKLANMNIDIRADLCLKINSRYVQREFDGTPYNDSGLINSITKLKKDIDELIDRTSFSKHQNTGMLLDVPLVGKTLFNIVNLFTIIKKPVSFYGPPSPASDSLLSNYSCEMAFLEGKDNKGNNITVDIGNRKGLTKNYKAMIDEAVYNGDFNKLVKDMDHNFNRCNEKWIGLNEDQASANYKNATLDQFAVLDGMTTIQIDGTSEALEKTSRTVTEFEKNMNRVFADMEIEKAIEADTNGEIMKINKLIRSFSETLMQLNDTVKCISNKNQNKSC